MSLAAARQNYVDLSGTASTVARQLCFAGIAVVWIFADKIGGNSAGVVDATIKYTIPSEMLWPLALFVLALAMDLLHYVVAAAIWGIYHRYKEIELGEDYTGEFGWPEQINWPANVFFWSKLLITIAGYIFLLLAINGFFGTTA